MSCHPAVVLQGVLGDKGQIQRLPSDIIIQQLLWLNLQASLVFILGYLGIETRPGLNTLPKMATSGLDLT